MTKKIQIEKTRTEPEKGKQIGKEINSTMKSMFPGKVITKAAYTLVKNPGKIFEDLCKDPSRILKDLHISWQGLKSYSYCYLRK